ncbi:MAG: membrane protein insertase YidC [Gemmatimonadota bacterium]
MQSGRFILAVVLMIAVVVITNVLFPPVPRTRPTEARDTVTQAPPAAAQPDVGVVAPPTQVAPPSRGDTVVVESGLYRYGISTLGAGIVSAEMLHWESYTREGPVQLAPRYPGGLLSYRVQIGEQQVDLAKLSFTPSTRYLRLEEGGQARTLRLTHSSSSYGVIEMRYEFEPDSYVADVSIAVRGTVAPPSRMLLDFGPRLAINEARAAEDERSLAYVVNSQQNGIQSVPLRSVKNERVEEGPLDWVALKNKYFVAAALVASDADARPFGGVLAAPFVAEKFAAHVSASLQPGSDNTFGFRLYIGPQEYDRLNALGHRFQDVNPYGWRVFRPIIRPLGHFITWMLLSMHEALALTYGWILILFGVIVRLLLWPLNAKAMRSQMKNMELQPIIKEIQTKYKNQPEVMQREMLKLYKEKGFNPMGGCLPMLIPFPVLITLFFVFQSSIEFRGVPFLWLPDLSRADPYYILPIILGATMLLQQWISMKTMPPNPQMKLMLWFMPLFMVIIFLNLASGLNLYYAAQNVPGFFQQIQLTKERERYQKQKTA